MAARVDPVRTYRIPKPSGGTRRMAVLSPADDAAWHRIGGAAVTAVEPLLGDRVLASRVLRAGSSWRAEPLRRALQRARLASARLGRGTPFVLRTDVESCYPSTDPSVAAASLRTCQVDRRVALRAADMLEGWGSEGYGGLPIGPPASAVLANAVLAGVDRQLQDLTFLRWVDDYLVAVRSERHVAEVLERLDLALQRVGLRRSAPKTTLLEGDRSIPWLGTLSGRASSKMATCDERRSSSS
jgi:hypothetical protein